MQQTSQAVDSRRSARALAALSAALLASVILALAAMPTQAAAAPVWDSEVFQGPSNLSPGGRGVIWIIPSNAGSDPSTGWPTVTFELPIGVTVAPPSSPLGWFCGGSPVVTCTNLFFGAFPVPPETMTTLLGQVGAPVRLTVEIAADAPQGSFPFDVTLADGGGDTATETHRLTVGSAQAGFGPEAGSFSAGAFDESGDDYTQAGGHPYQATASFRYNTEFNEIGDEPLTWFRSILAEGLPRDIVAELPPGFVGDPTSGPKCPDLGTLQKRRCPPASQVGVATISPPAGTAGRFRMFGVYNVEPAKDHPAELAFHSPIGTVLMVPTVRSDGDWGLNVSVRGITQIDTLFASSVTLWGVPADPSHDSQRCAAPNYVAQACVDYDEAGISFAATTYPADVAQPHASGAALRPFLTNPTECSGAPVETRLHLSEYDTPAPFDVFGDPLLSSPGWKTASAASPALTGCEKLQFSPSVQVSTTTSEPGAPTGLSFDLEVPQNDDPNGLASAHLRNATVVLPEGMTVNPSSADGLDACSSAQIGLTFKSPPRFDKSEPACPEGSKLGTVEVQTPLLEEPLTGEVHLARQADNPYDSLLAIYLVVRGPGILGKLAGHVQADPQTGRLSTTVVDNPQVPFDKLSVKLKGGPRAPLTMPSECGPKAVTADLTSWAGHGVSVEDSFEVACPGTGGGFAPGFTAGVSNPVGRSFTPLVARFTRDGGDVLSRIEMRLPQGMLAGLKDVGVCTGAQLAGAASKSGRSTQAGSVCPASSQIGTTTVGAGAGPNPFYPLIPGLGASGRVFLTDAHPSVGFPLAGGRQAAYGLAFEVPAVAGPFDLGTVLVRAAIYVDRTTAQVTVVSDPLPTILQGIPLNVRDIRVDVDRSRFAINPSDCSAAQVGAKIVAAGGASVQAASRFRVAGCAALAFKPKLGLRLTGRRQTRTGRHPGVRAVVRQAGLGEAGIEKAVVRLPKSLALDPDNAQALCEFADGTKPDLEARCPRGSIVGRARASSPLLKRPLAGNVYFVKNVRIDKRSGNQIRTLPMIVVALRGEIAINLRGESSTTKDGRLVNTFAKVPDAPISQFNLNIKGGGNGILTVTRTRRSTIDLCASRQTAEADIDGHNGRRADQLVRVKAPCGKGKQQRKPVRRGRP